MILLNYSHPLTPEHLEQVAALTDQAVERVMAVPAQLDNAQPFGPQVQALIAAAGLTAEEWQTLPLLVNLPSYNYAAAALLAQLHGLMGHFPAVLRLRPVAGAVPPRFEVAEVLDLNGMREKARERRQHEDGTA